jgi:hypothetical protein
MGGIEPEPTPEEAAAIMAALEVLRDARRKVEPGFGRWEFAARVGRRVPAQVDTRETMWAVAARLQQEGW